MFWVEFHMYSTYILARITLTVELKTQSNSQHLFLCGTVAPSQALAFLSREVQTGFQATGLKENQAVQVYGSPSQRSMLPWPLTV